MTHDRDPLTPEERALAERLARTSPRAEPAPALDARILAAARAAATEAPTVTARPRRRRWPATLGIAASLALAVGIAWQLRPLPQQAPPPVSEAPVSVAPSSRPAESAAQAIADVPATPADARDASARRPVAAQQAAPERGLAPPPQPRSQSAPEGASVGMEADTVPVRKTAPQATEAAQAKAQADEASRRISERQRESAIVLDAPSPAAAPAPAPPPPAEPAFVPSPPPVETAIGRRSVQQRAAAQADAVARPQRDARERTEVTGAPLPAASSAGAERDPFLDQPLDDRPPATADSPEVHKAWLARIRELHEDGEHEAARESLREFHRRHPEVELPEDLSGLLEE